MNKHTRTPWTLTDTTSGELGIRTSDGFICFLPKPIKYTEQEQRYKEETEEYIANAKFIVQAVNNHDSLVKALKTAQEALSKHWFSSNGEDEYNNEEIIKADNICQDALKKAGQGVGCDVEV